MLPMLDRLPPGKYVAFNVSDVPDAKVKQLSDKPKRCQIQAINQISRTDGSTHAVLVMQKTLGHRLWKHQNREILGAAPTLQVNDREANLLLKLFVVANDALQAKSLAEFTQVAGQGLESSGIFKRPMPGIRFEDDQPQTDNQMVDTWKRFAQQCFEFLRGQKD